MLQFKTVRNKTQQSYSFDSLFRTWVLNSAREKGWIAKHLKQEAFCAVTWYYFTNTHFISSCAVLTEGRRRAFHRGQSGSVIVIIMAYLQGLLRKMPITKLLSWLIKPSGLLCQPNSQAARQESKKGHSQKEQKEKIQFKFSPAKHPQRVRIRQGQRQSVFTINSALQCGDDRKREFLWTCAEYFLSSCTLWVY